MKPIITSLLDIDLYKYSMMWAVMQKFPETEVTYTFIDRNNLTYPPGFLTILKDEINSINKLVLTEDELNYLSNLRFFPSTFIAQLKNFKLNSTDVTVYEECNKLKILVSGKWKDTILWETIILCLVSEIYQRWNTFKIVDICNTINKAQRLKEAKVKFADFGTRRRYSKSHHYNVVKKLKEYGGEYFVGTSNVMLAKEFGIKPIGTVAHEWIMGCGALYGYKIANRIAMDYWEDVYKGDLGTALTDTYGTKNFFENFHMKECKLWDGVRQDSSNPVNFVDQTIAHYKKMGINPISKTIIFSDGLNIDKCIKLNEYCKGEIGCSFGIGTNLTCDIEGVKPLNIVMKLSKIGEINATGTRVLDCVKLSDESGKHTGNKDEIELCKKTLKID